VKTAILAALLACLACVACDAVVVDLGRAGADAAPDASTTPDATPCRCRIMDCRDAGDCTDIGGACGTDFYCVGDLGACTPDAQCQAIHPGNSFCAASGTSVLACGS
jgi:hypothetical protein